MDTLSVIHEAGQKLKLLNINYRKKDGSITTRIVEPYSIRGDKLYAYCTHSQGMRSFIVNNISSASLLDRGYSPRWPVEV